VPATATSRTVLQTMKLSSPQVVAFLLALLASCASVTVTPATIRAASAPAERREATLAAWMQSIAIANEFLASPYRRTLPPGSIELGLRGMRFVTEQGTWPLEIHCNAYGALVLAVGAQAQEREYGFVVGLQDGGVDRSLDNALFRHADSSLREPQDIAGTFLHEVTHVVYREGTVGFWNGVAYYLEAVFLLRNTKHSAERKAYATSHELSYFWITRDLEPGHLLDAIRETFEEHVADRTKHCRHGPFTEAPPAPDRRD